MRHKSESSASKETNMHLCGGTNGTCNILARCLTHCTRLLCSHSELAVKNPTWTTLALHFVGRRQEANCQCCVDYAFRFTSELLCEWVTELPRISFRDKRIQYLLIDTPRRPCYTDQGDHADPVNSKRTGTLTQYTCLYTWTIPIIGWSQVSFSEFQLNYLTPKIGLYIKLKLLKSSI